VFQLKRYVGLWRLLEHFGLGRTSPAVKTVAAGAQIGCPPAEMIATQAETVLLIYYLVVPLAKVQFR
jgi:hypothetical protein